MGLISDEFLIDRIRQPRPFSEYIVPESLPVTSFGDINRARSVTVGINPSIDEFRSRARGRPVLSGAKKRFVDREALNLSNDLVPDAEQAQQVLRGNHNYFAGNPYHWFNGLQNWALDAFGLSFREGTAAHVDLVQWATMPVWGRIEDPVARTRLVETDREFLRELIRQKEPEIVLLNGAFVSNEFNNQGLFVSEREFTVTNADRKLVISEGTVLGARAIGWNMNIQAQNSTADRQRLLEALSKLA